MGNMTKVEENIMQKIHKADVFFENKYFNEALFEYRRALNLTKELDEEYLENIKDHIINIFEKKARCFTELNQHTEVIQTYIKIVSFLDKNFEKTHKELFVQKNYSGISNAIVENYLEADFLQKELNFKESIFKREVALKLFNLISINIGDILFYKSPYEILRQAELYKLIGDYTEAQSHYTSSLDIANRYLGTEPEFFRPFIEEVFNKAMHFYEDIDDIDNLEKLLDDFIKLLEDSYNRGEVIDFTLAGDSYVRKGLLSKDEINKHKYFKKANEYYNYINSKDIEDPFFYNIAYVETNLYILIDPNNSLKNLESLAEFFLKKSTQNYGTLYYLKILKNLLIIYFYKKKLFRIFEIEKNLHINKSILRDEELEIYTGIEIFLKACKYLLEFQKNIYTDNIELRDQCAKKSNNHFFRLWKLSFIGNQDYSALLFLIAKLYRHPIKDDEKAFFYLDKIPNLYIENIYDEEANTIFADAFYELALYYIETGDFGEGLGYISKAIQLYKMLYTNSPIKHALKLHDSLLNRAVISYNYFGDYESFTLSIDDAIKSLESNIQDSTELIKLIKSISLKATIKYEQGLDKESLEEYEHICQLYKFYSFKNSGNLDRIYGDILDKGIILAQDLKDSKVEEFLMANKKSIKLFELECIK